MSFLIKIFTDYILFQLNFLLQLFVQAFLLFLDSMEGKYQTVLLEFDFWLFLNTHTLVCFVLIYNFCRNVETFVLVFFYFHIIIFFLIFYSISLFDISSFSIWSFQIFIKLGWSIFWKNFISAFLNNFFHIKCFS